MSNDVIPARVNGQTVDATWYNLIRTVISGDFYPRDAAHALTNNGASLGTSAHRWNRLLAGSAEFSLGSIKMRHSYNGLLTAGIGWMLCDGRQITKANYETEHGAGTWDLNIQASDLENRYLPNLLNKYLLGRDTIAQDGTTALSSEGSTGNQIDLSHTHRWYHPLASAATNDQYFANNTGSLASINNNTGNKTTGRTFKHDQGGADPGPGAADFYSEKKLSATQDIRPDSIEVLYFMRII